jgi:hypothetical protein
VRLVHCALMLCAGGDVIAGGVHVAGAAQGAGLASYSRLQQGRGKMAATLSSKQQQQQQAAAAAAVELRCQGPPGPGRSRAACLSAMPLPQLASVSCTYISLLRAQRSTT